jgi:hypothetical protein
MPLDPSMLIGFLCRYEAEWVDLTRRIALVGLAFFASLFELVLIWDGVCAQLPRTIFAIADDGEGSMPFFDKASLSASHGVSSSASHAHPSTHYHSNSNSTRRAHAQQGGGRQARRWTPSHRLRRCRPRRTSI